MRTLTFAAAILAAFPALAQDFQGRNLAAACAICHGSDGRAATKDLVPLAGLPKEYIAKQLSDFRDGKRPATVMHQISKGYTDPQIEALAAWYAAMKR
ncbi:MAG: c-type cytochrome [Candidatus Parcubacteria bacterium]|nr:c-type cytochrome [Burkholderiales bacterium]